jgi:hypothetical protein
VDRKQHIQGVEMALHTLNFWEITIDATQIGLCALILLFLIRNHMKLRRLNSNAPAGQESQKFNSEFVVEAVRQQTELAFHHILETIDKERQTLDAYFELRENQLAPGLLKSVPSKRLEPISSTKASEPDAADAIYSEIESLSDQGLSMTDIAEELNLPRGEVDLVLKLKRLSIESAKVKDSPQE